MNLCAYPLPDKPKSLELCKSFVAAHGGQMSTTGVLVPNTVAVFYGVDVHNLRAWQAVRAAGLPFVYLDNSYLDARRGLQFRATFNALQHDGQGESDGRRFDALDVQILPWRDRGRHVVICPQSPLFMRHCVRYAGDWLVDTLTRLGGSGLPARVRHWTADKPKAMQTLKADLVGAHVLVTHSSASAVEAILAGVPVIVSSTSAAACFNSTNLRDLCKPDEDARRRWASVLADNQFSLEEFRNGTAWEAIRTRGAVVRG